MSGMERENVQPGKTTQTAICTTCYSCPWQEKIDTASMIRAAYNQRPSAIHPDEEWVWGEGVRAGIGAVLARIDTWHKKTATCTTGGAKPVAERGGGVDIHKRITAAVLGTGLISTADCPNGCEGCEHEAGEIASAVIAALGLGPVVERYGARESDGTVYGWEPDAETVRREWPGMPVVRRYVTPWERIEEGG